MVQLVWVLRAVGDGQRTCTAKTTHASLELRVLSSGHRVMMPLNSRQTCSPAENLQISQGRNFAHRARKAKKRAGKRARSRRSVWRLGTWNVRSMVDTEGPVEVASQGTERGEERTAGFSPMSDLREMV